MHQRLIHTSLSIISVLILIVVFSYTEGNENPSSSPSIVVIDGANFSHRYEMVVNVSRAFAFEFTQRKTEETAVAIQTELSNKSDFNSQKFPVHIVVKQQLDIDSWDLPISLSHKYKFGSVSRFVCSAGQELNTTLPLTVEASTFSPNYIRLSLIAVMLRNFTLSLNKQYEIQVSPSSTSYYQYNFDPNTKYDAVTLIVTSDSEYCAFVSVQDSQCPVMDLLENIRVDGVYQSFLTQASIVIQRPKTTSSVFIVFVVSPTDLSCSKKEHIIPIDEGKVKRIKFWIEPPTEEYSNSEALKAYTRACILDDKCNDEDMIGRAKIELQKYDYKDIVYITASLGAIGYCFIFYATVLLVVIAVRCRMQNNEAELYQRISEMQPSNSDSTLSPSYGATSSREDTTPDSSDIRHHRANSGTSIDADMLRDIDEHKEVYRLKVNLTVDDMSRKSMSDLNKKYKLYYWNIITMSIFYGLPVVQLVLTYQTFLNVTGDQDLCYYNFRCSRRLGVLHNFNNILSNIGYVLLGILFMVVTYLRQKSIQKLPENVRNKCGIPTHFGLYYSMGWALIVEGVMSACYHVCPSYTNFQFDTSFMYIIGGVLMLRLFQSRHADINVNAHVAYLSLAAVIGIAVIGVLYNHVAFWIIFFIFYLGVTFFLSLQIYYVGRFRLDRQIFSNIRQYIGSYRNTCLQRPLYPSRLILLVILNAVNWGLGFFGVITQPSDFASFLLAIVIANLICYTLFYIVMKYVKGEKLLWPTFLFSIISMILWGFALYFFFNNVTSWQDTPAESRELNSPCIVFDFFDGHDVWHFLSAGAMFCSFLVVFHIDDDIREVPRTRIPVF